MGTLHTIRFTEVPGTG